MIKAVIFDMDGVLINSVKYNVKSHNMILRKYGIHVSKKVEKEFVGMSLKDKLGAIKKKYGNMFPFDVEAFSKESFKYQVEMMRKDLVKNKRLISLIKTFKRSGLKVGVATSSFKYRAETILKMIGIHGYLDAFVAKDDVLNHKPSPDLFLLASKRMKVLPSDCVVVEDAVNGIVAAKKAGMKTIGVTTSFKKKELEKICPDLIISNVLELNNKVLGDLNHSLIKAVIFDMDGVIVDSIPMHIKIWKIMFEKRGIKFSNKIFKRYNGSSTHDIGKRLIKKYSLNETPETIMSEKSFYEDKFKQKEIKMFEEGIPVLKMLKKKGYKVALATSSKKYMVDFLLKKFGFGKYFDSISFVNEVKRSKPSPDIFLLAAKKLKVNPKNCVVVEDAVNGVVAAKKACMTPIAITTTFKKNVFVNKSDYTINSLNKLFNVLEGLKCVE